MRIFLMLLDAALAIGLIAAIMMQSNQASGLGAIGGGGSGGQASFSRKKSKDAMLAKLTTYLAAAWMVVTLLITVFARRLG